MRLPKVLFCITVFNPGRSAKRSLESAARLSAETSDIEVLVLDDANPAGGWNDTLAGQAAALGFLYYRTPRALGISQLINIGLLAALKHGYDYVAINDSSLVFPSNMLTEMLKALQNPQVGSVTAFSNHASPYSLENENPEGFLPDQDLVDWLSQTLAKQVSGSVIDIPAGLWFSVLLPTDVVKRVGLLDPVFGRGSCEAKDWSLRSIARGYRVCLAPGVFVYHRLDSSYKRESHATASSGSLLEDEAILELRYPRAVNQIRAFQDSIVLRQAKQDAVICIIEQASRQFGYAVEIGWLPRTVKHEQHVSAHIFPRESNRAEVVLAFHGFRLLLACEQEAIAALLKQRLGREPIRVNLLDREEETDRICAAFDPSIVRELRNYPARI